MVNYDGLIRALEGSDAPIGLLTLQATSTMSRLVKPFDKRIKALFSAEHGFFGIAAAGEKTHSAWHPFWNRPIHSLYGDTRKPTPEMLEGIGVMIVDLCDLGVRCYTYLATIKLTLEACAEAGIPVIVLDRPIPMGGFLDGPMRKPEFASFVAPVNVPFCHGMTPGEEAVWIKNAEGLDVDMQVSGEADSGVENIYFTDPAPGEYQVYIDNYTDRTENEAAHYLVRVTIGNQSQTFEGTIDEQGTEITILEFDYAGGGSTTDTDTTTPTTAGWASESTTV